MKKNVMFISFLVVMFCLISCTGKTGPSGPQGPAGPAQPGLYYVKILQQGVYPSTYSGQVQSSLFDGMSSAYYTYAANPINLGYSNVGGVYRGIIKFDLSSLPSTKIMVDKAELTIKTNGNSAGGGALAITIHKVTHSWTEFQASWAVYATGLSWTLPGGDFDAGTITANATYDLPGNTTLTITLDPAVVQDWMLNPATNYGMLFKVSDEGTPNYSEIYSSGALTASDRPMLKIWYYTTE